MNLKRIALGTGLVLILIFLLQNTQVAGLRFLFWELRMSRIILFLILIAAGFLAGFLAGRKSWDW